MPNKAWSKAVKYFCRLLFDLEVLEFNMIDGKGREVICIADFRKYFNSTAVVLSLWYDSDKGKNSAIIILLVLS